MIVSDPVAFHEWADEIGAEALPTRDWNTYFLRSNPYDDYGRIPQYKAVAVDNGDQWIEDYEEFDFWSELRDHLEDGQIVHFYEMTSDDGSEYHPDIDPVEVNLTLVSIASGYHAYDTADVMTVTSTDDHEYQIDLMLRSLSADPLNREAKGKHAPSDDDEYELVESDVPEWRSAFDDAPEIQWQSAFGGREGSAFGGQEGSAFGESFDEAIADRLAIEHDDEEIFAIAYYDEGDDEDDDMLLLEHHS